MLPERESFLLAHCELRRDGEGPPPTKVCESSRLQQDQGFPPTGRQDSRALRWEAQELPRQSVRHSKPCVENTLQTNNIQRKRRVQKASLSANFPIIFPC